MLTLSLIHIFFGTFHVNKIHHNDAGEIAQPQLPPDFPGSLQIQPEDGFRHVLFAGVFSGIDVDDRHGLGGLNDQITAGFQPDPPA